MHILKICGFVVAVHVAAFMILFANPGCRATGPRQPTPTQTAPETAQPSVTYPGSTAAATASAPAAAPYPVTSSSDVSAAPTARFSPVESSGGIRFNPTRPGTPAANALQTAPVSDVIPATTYTVAKNDSLWTVARKHGLSVETLATANNLKTGATLVIGKKLIIPAKGAANTAARSGPGIAGDVMTYQVRPNETLGEIARNTGTSVATIKALNKLQGDSVQAGQKLVLPAGASANAFAAPVDSVSSKKSTSKAAGGSSAKHTVRPGETLDQIARIYGVSSRDIGVANHIADPRTLRAGQEITIPGAKPKVVTTAPAQAEPAAQPEATYSPISGAPEASPISSQPVLESPPVNKVEESSPITTPKN